MRIDLNADIGEGMVGPDGAGDEALLRWVTSANVACGGHTGSLDSMRLAVKLSLAHGVAIGAHPSYPDREGFGRIEMPLSPAAIEALVTEQVDALVQVARAEGTGLTHVKPHGALYNRAARDGDVAAAIVRAVAGLDRRLIVVGLAGSALVAAAAAADLQAAHEGFADRAYQAGGTLVPRTRADAVIHDEDVVVARAVSMVIERRVLSAEGEPVPTLVDTLCLHGDTPGAPQLARRIREALSAAGVEVRALAR